MIKADRDRMIKMLRRLIINVAVLFIVLLFFGTVSAVVRSADVVKIGVASMITPVDAVKYY